MTPLNILILDIETTGLDPAYDCILEIAFIPAQLTPEGLLIDYDSQFTSVVMPQCNGYTTMQWQVHEMHNNSGLMDLLRTTPNIKDYDVSKVEERILQEIDKKFGRGAKYLQLCGNSVHFDKSFIRQHMRALDARLSYRILDMTTFRTIKDSIKPEKRDKSHHRALMDCKYSASLLKEFYEVLCKHTSS